MDRVVELAVRNQVRVPGLAAWDEVARALQGTVGPAASEMDTLFAIAADSLTGDDAVLTIGDADQVIEEGAELAVPDIDEAKVPLGKMSIPAKIRIATMGNAFARGVLVRDPVRLVAIAAIKSPGVTDIEAARYAGNQSLGEDVIRYIAANRNWTKLYGIKVALCRNPKTPVAEISRILPFLREKDLANIGRSKGIPSAVVAQARKLISQRRGGKG
ncbi:MAG: hypothetical protein H0T79_07615 [Deltaproteobacteria bacterium]|nr:hypothetical protein [Deltaproteobacteria bacterium]